MNKSYLQRFQEKFLVTPGCWIWMAGCSSNGYGAFRFEGVQYRAHRHSYSIYVGPIKEGMLILHRCDNPKCVNPDHLFQGTALENAADRDRKGRTNPPIGERARAAILNVDKVRKIFADKRKHHVIAVEYGVTRVAVTNIKNGTRWAHLNLGVCRESRNYSKPR